MFGYADTTGSSPWILNIPEGVYQHFGGSHLGKQINPLLFPLFPCLPYDSWFTLSNDPYSANVESITDLGNDIFADFEAGLSFTADTPTGSTVFGAWSNGDSQGLPDADNKVLLAQITVESGADLSGTWNLQIRRLNPDGSIYDPPGVDQSEIVTVSGFDWSITSDFDPCQIVFLPVTLTSFSAKPSSGGIALNWTTESELSLDRFEVQRSKEGIDFEHVTAIAANGNISNHSQYGALDDNPYVGYSYYRLKAVDINGEHDYSDLRRVEFRPTSVEVYPNPASITVNISGFAEDIEQVRLLDIRGALVRKWHVTNQVHMNASVSNLPVGVYFLELCTKFGAVQSERLVIKP